MYKEISKLILFSELGEDSIILKLSGICRDFDEGKHTKDELNARLNAEVKRILDLATACGFNENLWQNYLTYILLTNENSFTLTAERRGAMDGTVNILAKRDFAVFKKLFAYDFSRLEAGLETDCFSLLTNYKAIPKREKLYNRHVSETVQALSRRISAAKDENEVFDILNEYYSVYGVGLFGLNRAFRIEEGEGGVQFIAINNADSIILSDLIGYEYQKKQLLDNTKAFLAGKGANNVLLYGDAGTGKSSSVKALLNEYWSDGLRMIEIYKHQFHLLSEVISKIKTRNYRFIILIDDLSFEENEVEYKFFKAVIEGGVETKPDNVLIYATSNRRHLIKETWNDRSDMEHNGDIHRSDTIEEKLSLAARFGVLINYNAPNKVEFNAIVKGLAEKYQLKMDEDRLLAEANKWEISHGGFSGRTAKQFINYIEGLEAIEKGE